MKMPLLTSTWEGSNKLASVMILSNVILAVGVVIAVGKLVTDHEVTRIVPPHLTKAVSVGWESADQEYLESFGSYVATLTANITPKNVDFVIARLSGLVTPRVYTNVRQQLLVLSKNPVFKHNGGSVRFDPSKVVSEKETEKVFILGQMTTQSIGGKDTKNYVIEMKVVMRDGRPWVDSLDHYEGSDPHTLTWIEKNPVLAQEARRRQAESAATQADQILKQQAAESVSIQPLNTTKEVAQ